MFVVERIAMTERSSEPDSSRNAVPERDADEFLGPARAAHMLHVSPKTINRWANEGRIPCVVTLGGHRRFKRSDVDTVLQGMTERGSSLARE